MMNKKISVLLSSSIEFRNSGMFSVDYSAYLFFSKNFPDCDLKFYVFHLSDESKYPYSRLMPYSIYNKIDNENINEIMSSDMIVYWSDFFHNRHFVSCFLDKYILPKSYDKERDLSLFYSAFFLEGQPSSVYEKTIAFGTSMISLNEITDDRHGRNLSRILSNVYAYMPRDKKSFYNIIVHAEKIKGFRQGCDPAFLIGEFNQQKRQKTIGLFWGRRTEINIKGLIKIIKFAREKDLKIEWIDWMMNTESFFLRSIKNPRQAKNLFMHCLLRYFFKAEHKEFKNEFTTLGRYSMVITDTYHLAINSLRENTPVFCISNDDVIYGRDEQDLHDIKKEVLFSMLENKSSCGIISYSGLNDAYNFDYLKSKYFKEVKRIKSKLIQNCKNILGD